MKTTLRNIRFIIREEMGRYPLLYPIFKLKKKPQARLISNETQLVIEGLQRSGNTFMVAYFKLTNPDEVISSHYHFLSQIVIATKKELPTIVLIRNPKDTIPSFMMRDPGVSLRQILKYTKQFFQALLRYKDHIVISDFQETISAPHQVILNVNKKFNTNFNCPEVDASLKVQINRLVEEMDKISRGEEQVDEMMVSRPSEVREESKKELLASLASYQGLLDEVEKTYLDILNKELI